MKVRESDWPMRWPAHMDKGMTSLGWYQVKLFIEHASAISMDALHVLVGVGVMLVAALLLKRNLASALPWLATLLLAVCNEVYDLHVELWPDVASQLGEAAKDLLLTMALPTLLLLVARRRPTLLASQVEPVRQD